MEGRIREWSNLSAGWVLVQVQSSYDGGFGHLQGRRRRRMFEVVLVWGCWRDIGNEVMDEWMNG